VIVNVPMNSLRFMINGSCIKDSDTPLFLLLKDDDDEIGVYHHLGFGFLLLVLLLMLIPFYLYLGFISFAY